MMVNGTVVKHWSRTQASRSLSTAEAEYYTVEMGAAADHGMQSMMTNLGLSVRFSCMDRLQRNQSDCFEKRTWKCQTRIEKKRLQEVT